MKLSILSTFSVIACAFIGFVFASPMDSKSLVARDTESTVLAIILDASNQLDACHASWITTCGSSCGPSVVSGWGNACTTILNVATTNCLAAIPPGWVFSNPSACVSLLVIIIQHICSTLITLLTACGLLGDLIAVLILLIPGLGNLIPALSGLLTCLVPTILNLLSLIIAELGDLVCPILALLSL